MIITLKNARGIYIPLDTFEDFEIKYNHQYEDYSTIGGRKIPYSNKFKIPTTNRNRNLCTIPFDLAYPLQKDIDGRMLYEDGTLAFEFVAQTDGQTINVLEPYIEISIIDKISKAIQDLSIHKMSDLMGGNTFNISTDTWMFGDQSGLTDAKKFYLFSYYNFNNRKSTVAYDAKRNLNQLQPTYVLNKLVDKMFNYIGLTINSDFLNIDEQLGTGIMANELGLMLPTKLMTKSDYVFDTSQSFSGIYNDYLGNTSPEVAYNAITERIAGVPVPMISTSRLNLSDFMTLSSVDTALKLHYDSRSDFVNDGALRPHPYSTKYCSKVDGKMKVKITPNPSASKPLMKLGRLHTGYNPNLDMELNDFNGYFPTRVVSVETVSPPDLDVRLVNASRMEEQFGVGYASLGDFGSDYYERAIDYDINESPVVGTASYVGIDPYYATMNYEITLNDTSVELDVKANAEMGLCLMVTPKPDVVEYIVDYTLTDVTYGGLYTYQMIIKEGYIQFERTGVISGTHDDLAYDYLTIGYVFDNFNPTSEFTLSFPYATEIPAGYGLMTQEKTWISNSVVSMGESYKESGDISLLSVLKMIMERFNLLLYTTSDGSIHLDTNDNRKSGIVLNIDSLLDEGMSASFTYGDKGILSVKDSNPSFYEDDFNALKEKIVSETKRESHSFTFNSSIVSNKMFEDVYDSSSEDLLRFRGNNNYWGTADRVQVEPSQMKPAFCFIKPDLSFVYFPYINCSNSFVLSDPPLDANGDVEPQLDLGFYNTFFHFDNIHPVIKTKAVNMSSDGFSLVSFEDNDYKTGDNIFEWAWLVEVLQQMDDRSVNAEFDIYVSESNLSVLKDFPTIKFKGQEWEFKGLNDYPLSSKNGGICKITLVNKLAI